VVGVPPNFAKIDRSWFGACRLATRAGSTRVVGDAVARREVHARIAEVRSTLQEELRAGILHAKWQIGAEPAQTGLQLSRIASTLADKLFSRRPKSERVGQSRKSIEQQCQGAPRLMHRMLTHESQENLGIEGFPAERGL
jgi:hypothetical protein